jgi:hypothetical protein
MESFVFFNFVLKMKVEIALRSMGNLFSFLPSFQQKLREFRDNIIRGSV